MATVIRKRLVDVITHPVDYTAWLVGTDTIASVVTEVVGEQDQSLTVASTAIDGSVVNVKLDAGTSEAIYQVYVTATFASGLAKELQFEVDMEQDIDAPPFIGEVCVGVLATPAYATGAFSPDYYSDDGDHSVILIESGTGDLVQATLKVSLTIIVYASGQAPPVLDQITVAYVGPMVLADSSPVDLTGFVQESQAGYRIGGLTARLDAGALVLGVTAIAGPTAIARAKITGEACFRGTYNGS